MYKIALIAGPGAGKTTLAHALTAALKDRGKKWYCVQEVAREFIDEWGADAMTHASVPLLIANRQMRREKRVNSKADGFVTDSPLILPWFYAKALPVNSGVEKYSVLSTLYKMFLRSFIDYDLLVHVTREKPYVEDGCRTQTEAEAKQLDSAIVKEVKSHGFQLFDVHGTTQNRVEMIVDRYLSQESVR